MSKIITVPSREVVRLAIPKARLVGPWSPEFGLGALISGFTAPAVTTWSSANDPVAIPFRPIYPMNVIKLGWQNGSTVTTNWDMGIYDSVAGVPTNRLVSCGSTARVSANNWQFVDTADTLLTPPNIYWLVGVNDSTAASNFRGWSIGGASIAALLGMMDSATDAFPLPNPLTNMAAAATTARIGVMGMVCVGLVA